MGPIQKKLRVSDRQILRTLRRMKVAIGKAQSWEEAYLCHLFEDEVVEDEVVEGRSAKLAPLDCELLSEEVIQSRLVSRDGSILYTYNEWVRSWHPKVHEWMVRSRGRGETNPFQEGRKQWLDSLIAEYSEKVR